MRLVVDPFMGWESYVRADGVEQIMSAEASLELHKVEDAPLVRHGWIEKVLARGLPATSKAVAPRAPIRRHTEHEGTFELYEVEVTGPHTESRLVAVYAAGSKVAVAIARAHGRAGMDKRRAEISAMLRSGQVRHVAAGKVFAFEIAA